MPSKAATTDLSVAVRRLDGAERADGWLVGLDEHAAHIRVCSQHILGELERFVSRVGLHLL